MGIPFGEVTRLRAREEDAEAPRYRTIGAPALRLADNAPSSPSSPSSPLAPRAPGRIGGRRQPPQGALRV